MSNPNELLNSIRKTLRTAELYQSHVTLQQFLDTFNELDKHLSGGGAYPDAWSFWQQARRD